MLMHALRSIFTVAVFFLVKRRELVFELSISLIHTYMGCVWGGGGGGGGEREREQKRKALETTLNHVAVDSLFII